MTGREKQKELARYRVQQAQESLEFRPLAYLPSRWKLVRRPRNYLPGITNLSITKAQLEYLAQRVRKLQRLTKKICQARIESYLSA